MVRLTAAPIRWLRDRSVPYHSQLLEVRFPHTAQRYVGAHSRGCKRYGASPIANTELSIQEQDAILAIDRSGPKVSATHGKRSHRRIYTMLFLCICSILRPREAECSRACFQCDFGRTFLRTEDEAIDDDVCVLAERKRATVVKGDLQARVRSGAETVIHMHWRAHNRRLRANLRLVLHSGHSANDAFSASTQV